MCSYVAIKCKYYCDIDFSIKHCLHNVNTEYKHKHAQNAHYSY